MPEQRDKEDFYLFKGLRLGFPEAFSHLLLLLARCFSFHSQQSGIIGRSLDYKSRS